MSDNYFEKLKYEAVLADGKNYRIYNDYIYDDVATLNSYGLVFYVKTACDVQDEDWKTAVAHRTPAIPKGTELKVDSLFINYYGQYIKTTYNGIHYYIDPRKVNYSRSEKVVIKRVIKRGF